MYFFIFFENKQNKTIIQFYFILFSEFVLRFCGQENEKNIQTYQTCLLIHK